MKTGQVPPATQTVTPVMMQVDYLRKGKTSLFSDTKQCGLCCLRCRQSLVSSTMPNRAPVPNHVDCLGTD